MEILMSIMENSSSFNFQFEGKVLANPGQETAKNSYNLKF